MRRASLKEPKPSDAAKAQLKANASATAQAKRQRLVPPPYPAEWPVVVVNGTQHIVFPPQVREDVELLAAGGTAKERIASMLHLSVEQLEANFSEELLNGGTRANLRMIRNLYERGLHSVDHAPAIWWSKARMRWTQVVEQEVVVKTEEQFAHAVSKAPATLRQLIAARPDKLNEILNTPIYTDERLIPAEDATVVSETKSKKKRA